MPPMLRSSTATADSIEEMQELVKDRSEEKPQAEKAFGVKKEKHEGTKRTKTERIMEKRARKKAREEAKKLEETGEEAANEAEKVDEKARKAVERETDLVEERVKMEEAKAQKKLQRAQEIEARRLQERERVVVRRAMRMADKRREKGALMRVSTPPFEIRFDGAFGIPTDHADLPKPELRIIPRAEGVELLVHRDVLTAHSDHLKALLAGIHEIDNPNELELRSECPLALVLVIKYCYSHRYFIHSSYDARILDLKYQLANMTNPLMIHARVFALSKNYGIPALTELAFEAFKTELSSNLQGAWTAETAFYQRVARHLLAVMLHSTTGKAPLDDELRDFIIDAWRKDEWKLARCYTTEEDFYSLLVTCPEIVNELADLGAEGGIKYKTLPRGEKRGCGDKRAEFFRPFGLHTPIDQGWWVAGDGRGKDA